MNRENAGRALVDEILDEARIDIVRGDIHIAEDGTDAVPPQRMSRCDEGPGRRDDLTLEPRRRDGDLERRRPTGHGHAVADAADLSNRLLELAHEGAVIREPLAVEHLLQAAHQPGSVADVRLAHMARFRERRRTAEHREVGCRHRAVPPGAETERTPGARYAGNQSIPSPAPSSE